MNTKQKQSVRRLHQKLRRAVEQSGKTLHEIGVAMGQKPEHARKVVSRILCNEDFDLRVSTLLALSDAIDRPLSELLSDAMDKAVSRQVESRACRHCRSPVMAWLVWAPTGDEHDYHVFAERSDAEDKANEFDDTDPNNEHVIEALAIRPYPM